ncbi:MAG TPA: HAD-IIIA family hydrolase [Bacteroidales bacterium]|nr:HAD-IIIA family hydrolase [Bacteroidales bacterium]
MKRKAIFLDRDGVINVEKTFVLSPEEMDLYPGSADAVRRINESGYLAIVVTNQSAVARNYITPEELGNIHDELKRLLAGRGAKADAIYYCPHRERLDEEPGNPEFIMDCECRKPKPGMLYQAADDFDIDLTRSYLIGDSARDILAGKRAGCTTIGLKTGHALKGIEQKPDYVFDDLWQAVDYILKADE